jgi:hypothetical protein
MLNKVKDYFKNVMQDSEGNPSSKRWITLLCTVLLATAFIANLFFGFKVEQYMFDAVAYIVIAGVGIAGAEKFAKK